MGGLLILPVKGDDILGGDGPIEDVTAHPVGGGGVEAVGPEEPAGSIRSENLAVEEHGHPDLEVKTARAEGLRDCRKLMMMAKAGKYKGYLLEGMACPGGCVAGAGTILPVDKAAKFVEKYSKEAANASPTQSAYRDAGEDLD